MQWYLIFEMYLWDTVQIIQYLNNIFYSAPTHVPSKPQSTHKHFSSRECIKEVGNHKLLSFATGNANFFFLNLFIGFYHIIYTVLQCDLPPLRPHCGEAPGRDSNPGRVAQRQGHYPWTTKNWNDCKSKISLHCAESDSTQANTARRRTLRRLTTARRRTLRRLTLRWVNKFCRFSKISISMEFRIHLMINFRIFFENPKLANTARSWSNTVRSRTPRSVSLLRVLPGNIFVQNQIFLLAF